MQSRILKTTVQWIGLIAGPVLALLLYSQLPGAYPNSAGEQVAFSSAARATMALAAWMAVWWMTEAVELYATALLPLVALPMAGASAVREAAAPYAHELIFLFMGGFLIALAMQRWGLHRRLALRALHAAGDHPAGIVACYWASPTQRPSEVSARSSGPRPTSSSRYLSSPVWARRSASSGGWAWDFPSVACRPSVSYPSLIHQSTPPISSLYDSAEHEQLDVIESVRNLFS